MKQSLSGSIKHIKTHYELKIFCYNRFIVQNQTGNESRNRIVQNSLLSLMTHKTNLLKIHSTLKSCVGNSLAAARGLTFPSHSPAHFPPIHFTSHIAFISFPITFRVHQTAESMTRSEIWHWPLCTSCKHIQMHGAIHDVTKLFVMCKYSFTPPFPILMKVSFVLDLQLLAWMCCALSAVLFISAGVLA